MCVVETLNFPLGVIGLFCRIVNAMIGFKPSGWFLGSDVRGFKADKLRALAEVTHGSGMDHHGCIKCRERARCEEKNLLGDEATKRRMKNEEIPARLILFKVGAQKLPLVRGKLAAVPLELADWTIIAPPINKKVRTHENTDARK